MIITDHINFFPEHPLRGKNFPTGPRFPDMHETYDKKLIAEADAIAAEKGIRVVHGVYVGVQVLRLRLRQNIRCITALAETP